MASRRLLPDASVPGADLPVRPALDHVIAATKEHGTAVLVAPPGSGKTSLLPLALADAVDGPVVVAEPRRLATRAAAQRLAMLVGEEPGRSIGYAMRGERAGGRDTRVEVVTTGLLVQRLQRDPELPGVAAVIIDECHERHLDADLALAFCVDVRATLRNDLALVATSATPDVAALTAALASSTGSVVTADANRYAVETIWAPPPVPLPLLPGARVDRRLLTYVADVTRRALADGDGDVLVFVPGESEIGTVTNALTGAAEVLPLYGRQTRAEQQRVFTRSSRRRVVVTTSVAESSLTVPGVRAVVDAGLARQPRLDPARGLTALVTTRVSKASADQRAGRAGREGPGRVYRCWSEAEHVHLAAQTPPEIATTDLAGFALSVAAWGAPGGAGLALLDAPPGPALAAAQDLLQSLDAVDEDGRITARGRRLAAVGTHPRLARALLDGAELVGSERAHEVVALLSDDSLAGRGDDLPARLRELSRGQDRAATARWREEIRRLGRASPDHAPDAGVADDLATGIVVGLAYPGRLARARRPDSTTYLTSAGTGAALADGSGLRGTPWLAIAVADRPMGRTDARIRSAAPIDESTARIVAADLVQERDDIAWADGALVARRVEALGAVPLSESPLADPDPLRVLAAVRDGIVRSGLDVLPWTDGARSLRQRLAFCHAHLGDPWPAVDDDTLLAGLDTWLGADLGRVRRTRDLARIDVTSALRRLLPWPAATRFDDLAPERLEVPSGSRVRVTYDGAAAPVVAVKLQETFGWTSTPALADGRVPVVLHLLSPAGRTVAVTADLTSFWTQGYPQVRSELRARYPKHPWPEDPLTATPTARTRRSTRQ